MTEDHMGTTNDIVGVFFFFFYMYIISIILYTAAAQGSAQGFIKCELSPEPYEAISTAQLGSGF